MNLEEQKEICQFLKTTSFKYFLEFYIKQALEIQQNENLNLRITNVGTRNKFRKKLYDHLNLAVTFEVYNIRQEAKKNIKQQIFLALCRISEKLFFYGSEYCYKIRNDFLFLDQEEDPEKEYIIPIDEDTASENIWGLTNKKRSVTGEQLEVKKTLDQLYYGPHKKQNNFNLKVSKNSIKLFETIPF